MQGEIEKQGSIGIIWIDNPPVNAISHAVREGLMSAVETAASDDSIKALVLACRGRTFMAGADITEFGSGPKPPSLGAVIDVISASPKIIIAALFGTAFGGGLEVALGCDYRVASETTKIGLPEVKLGIIPGAQGTPARWPPPAPSHAGHPHRRRTSFAARPGHSAWPRTGRGVLLRQHLRWKRGR